MMKIKLLQTSIAIFSITMLSTTSALAEGYFATQDENSQMTLAEKKEKIRDCGHYDEVGVSTIFGAPNEYQSKYPKVGYLSAELDRVAKIKPETRKSVQVIFQDAKDKWNRIDYSLEKNRKMIRRNAEEITTTELIKDNTMNLFRSNQGKLEKQQAFVLSKALKDSTAALHSDKRRVMRDEYTLSSWEELEVCRNWWKYEQSEVPQWQKNHASFNNRLDEMKGQNYGYGVESQYSDGRSSSKNAQGQASSRLNQRSQGFDNQNLKRFRYDYQGSAPQADRRANNGGLEMQW